MRRVVSVFVGRVGNFNLLHICRISFFIWNAFFVFLSKKLGIKPLFWTRFVVYSLCCWHFKSITTILYEKVKFIGLILPLSVCEKIKCLKVDFHSNALRSFTMLRVQQDLTWRWFADPNVSIPFVTKHATYVALLRGGLHKT